MYLPKQAYTLSKIFRLCKYLKIKVEWCQMEMWPTVWTCKTNVLSSHLSPPRNNGKLSQLQAALVMVSHVTVTICKGAVVVPINPFWWYAVYQPPQVYSFSCPLALPQMLTSCVLPTALWKAPCQVPRGVTTRSFVYHSSGQVPTSRYLIALEPSLSLVKGLKIAWLTSSSSGQNLYLLSLKSKPKETRKQLIICDQK